jgi:hypothetical protein
MRLVLQGRLVIIPKMCAITREVPKLSEERRTQTAALTLVRLAGPQAPLARPRNPLASP